LAAQQWSSGRKITAQQVARILRRNLASSSNNPLKETLGAVDEIVAMTDRVLEIRLAAPRPNLLQLLAQPELALVHEGEGSGPFTIAGRNGREVRLQREVEALDEDEARREQLTLQGADVASAVRGFVSGDVDLVLGGTFADLPVARQAKLPRGALQFDPVAGLFGLVPARSSGPAADADLRRLLTQAIDRDALIASFDVPGLVGRATLLEAGLDGVPGPVVPAWMGVEFGERRPSLISAADTLFGGEERPTIRLALPEGPGGELLLGRLREDWGMLGLTVERAAAGSPADFRLIEAVAPSTSPAWFLRQFLCDERPICSEDADELLEAARAAPVPAQRAALLAEAARVMEEAQLFLPIAAPIRWSLVSNRIEGFTGNRFARHTLTELEETLAREGAD
jgi:peptide/nickel transport system substrate-binding protein